MERYITLCVKPQDQARLRTMTKKDYILAMLKKKRRFYIRYQVKENLQKLKHIELHFSTAGKSAGEHSAIFAFRDVNAVVEQEERYRLETRRDIENILEAPNRDLDHRAGGRLSAQNVRRPDHADASGRSGGRGAGGVLQAVV